MTFIYIVSFVLQLQIIKTLFSYLAISVPLRMAAIFCLNVKTLQADRESRKIKQNQNTTRETLNFECSWTKLENNNNLPYI